MASVALQGLFLHDVDNPADGRFFLKGDVSISVAAQVETRRFATGRVRMIRRPGQQRTFQASLPLLDKDQSWWLKTHAGVLMLIRDPAGNKLYGVYDSASFAESPWNGTASAAVTFAEVTVAEAA